MSAEAISASAACIAVIVGIAAAVIAGLATHKATQANQLAADANKLAAEANRHAAESASSASKSAQEAESANELARVANERAERAEARVTTRNDVRWSHSLSDSKDWVLVNTGLDNAYEVTVVLTLHDETRTFEVGDILGNEPLVVTSLLPDVRAANAAAGRRAQEAMDAGFMYSASDAFNVAPKVIWRDQAAAWHSHESAALRVT